MLPYRVGRKIFRNTKSFSSFSLPSSKICINVIKMKMSGLRFISTLLVFLLAAFSIAHGGRQNRTDITTPPADSAEAERVRIWLPIERQSRCRVTIDILNDSNQIVRHLVDQLMSPGYYNFYWDKKDDSGRFVKAGEYAYLVKDCSRKSYGQVMAEFKKWEAASRVYPPEEAWSTNIGFELLEDSALVSINIYNRRDMLTDSPVVDSLMNKGKYEFEWTPAETVPRGIYTLKLTVGDFTHTIEIGYRP
jgi:hypothetical protein